MLFVIVLRPGIGARVEFKWSKKLIPRLSEYFIRVPRRFEENVDNETIIRNKVGRLKLEDRRQAMISSSTNLFRYQAYVLVGLECGVTEPVLQHRDVLGQVEPEQKENEKGLWGLNIEETVKHHGVSGYLHLTTTTTQLN